MMRNELSDAETNEMIAFWEEKGNTVEELGELIATATFSMPQLGWYSKEYCKSERLKINTAKYCLRQLPHGRRILGD